MKTGLGVAIKSPTGSGKSFVILEYVRRLVEEHKGQNYTVVVTTGFNNLVYQLYRDAVKEFGLDPVLWVGQGHIASEDKVKQRLGLDEDHHLHLSEHQAFTQDPSLRASPKERCVGRSCRTAKETGVPCLFHQARAKIKGFGTKVVFTNHTSYLIGLKYNTIEPDVTVVDESHTFAMYYESFNTDTITPEEIKYIQSKLDTSDPTLMLFRRAIERGMNVSPQIFNQVKKKLNSEREERAVRIANKLDHFSGIEPGIDKYLEVSPSVGMEVTNFWSRFDVKQGSVKYLLVSATQDSFTLSMFQIPKQNLYVEMDANTIDYRQSEFLVYKDEEYGVAASRFLSRMREEGKTRGLMLSTTNKDIRYLKGLGELEGFTVTTSKEEFDSHEGPVVLAGSRVLFQGIDIPSLEFVSLNKIPFPSYDDKFKAMATYLENIAGIDPWMGYTMPKVDNDLTQSTGRLWRKPGDRGTIAIFDDRLDGKFSYFVKSIKRERPGIRVEVIENDPIS